MAFKIEKRTCLHVLFYLFLCLFNNFGYNPGGNGAAAFSDGEA